MACGNKDCGCHDVGLTTPAPCNEFLCPTPNPCSETFDACCIIYTGPDVGLVKTGDRLCDIIQILATQGGVGPDACYTPDACFAPITGFNAIADTATSVVLSWIPSTATSYRVRYRKFGTTTWLYFGLPLAGAIGTVTVTGLLANTEYEFFIESSCETV